jgi:hypothetical protein
MGRDFVRPRVAPSTRVFHIVKQPLGNFICPNNEFGLDTWGIVAQIMNAGAFGGQLLGR